MKFEDLESRKLNRDLSMELYFQEIERECVKVRSIAEEARKKGLDPSSTVESAIVEDLAQRVSRLLGLGQLEGFEERLRDLLRTVGKENTALILAQEIALGKFGFMETQRALEYAVRTGLAIMTDGVTVAPIQGLYSVRIKENFDGSNYASLVFAGPIRSAGGTEAAFTLVIADTIAKKLGLSRYLATDEEVDRFVEELRIYERDVGNFQFRVSDEDVRFAISNLPVELDGVETDPVEVVIHRNIKRVSTNRLRGGALRVLNDGIIGRANKLYKKLKDLNIAGWEWLTELKKNLQSSSSEIEQNKSHFDEVISGRAVLSMPGKEGGFRLRYGRSMNTGLSTVGIHPTVAALLDYPVTVGTQVKVDLPGKAATVGFVDSIEPPTVLLNDGTVKKVRTIEEARTLKDKVEQVLDLGDILVSYGDFLENAKRLIPSAYVYEWWLEDLREALGKNYLNMQTYYEEFSITKKILENPRQVFPEPEYAIKISKAFDIPLCPIFTPRFDKLSAHEVFALRKAIRKEDSNYIVELNDHIERVLRKLLVEYTRTDNKAFLEHPWGYILYELLRVGEQIPIQTFSGDGNGIVVVQSISGLKLGFQSTRTIGVRVGRPEKAMIRKMKPPVHSLFPVGREGGHERNLVTAAKKGNISVQLANAICPVCKERKLSSICEKCNEQVVRYLSCLKCGIDTTASKCPKCGNDTLTFSNVTLDLGELFSEAASRVHCEGIKKVKGVIGLNSQSKFAERIEKGILRSKHNVYVYKDGTIRIDITNAPLTHFRARDIKTSVDKLRELGYTRDIFGNELVSDEQIIELKPQDLILPEKIAGDLLRISKFLDDELTNLYDLRPFYKANSDSDLLGHLVVGLAPHTSAGIVGRIVGFSNAQVCFANPCWHAAKRRDCDGDSDSIILLLDVFLNFSAEFIPDQIGGLMDVPLLIQPVILPEEVDEQAHNFDIASEYPKQFYEATIKQEPAATVEVFIETIKKRLGNNNELCKLLYTHHTNSIIAPECRSAYAALRTLKDKISKQIEIANKIRAVSVKEVVESIIKTHLLRDIAGNAKKYASQAFKCKKCGTVYRRITLSGRCLKCGGELRETLTSASVSKYLKLAKELADRYSVDEYLINRIHALELELEQLFEKKASQLEITSF